MTDSRTVQDGITEPAPLGDDKLAPLGDDELEAADRFRSAVGGFVRHVRRHDTMPGGQSAVLGYLNRDGDLSITELANRERVRHQSMARTVKLLTAQGLVGSITDPQDRRRVSLRITPAGVSALQAARLERSAWIARAVQDRLDPEERAVLARLPAVLAKLMPIHADTR